MKRFLCATALAALAMAGCEKNKAPPNPPTPRTAEAMQAVVAATPASDRSLPAAATAIAELESGQGSTAR